MEQQAPKIQIIRVQAPEVQIPEPPPAEPAPGPRFFDQAMSLYVKIGGYVGVCLAAAAFLGICAISWALFYHMLIPKGYFLLAGIAAAATIAVGAMVAVGIFFWASLMWLPTLVGLCFMFLLSLPILARLHH